MYTIFWLKNMKGKDPLKDLGIDRRIISECILGTLGGMVWIACIWFRIGTNGKVL
jgi:hypothetical protein